MGSAGRERPLRRALGAAILSAALLGPGSFGQAHAATSVSQKVCDFDRTKGTERAERWGQPNRSVFNGRANIIVSIRMAASLRSWSAWGGCG